MPCIIFCLGVSASLPPFSRWKSTNQNPLVKHSWAQQQKQQMQYCHLFWWTDGTITVSFKCFLNGCHRHLHPQCPSSQYFHQLLQLFRTHGFLPPHVPKRIIVPGVRLQKDVQYFPWLVNIALPKGQPSTREKETRIESWMKASQPAMPTPWKKNTGIYPHLTLLWLMQLLLQIRQPLGFCHFMLYATTVHYRVS